MHIRGKLGNYLQKGVNLAMAFQKGVKHEKRLRTAALLYNNV